MEAPPSHSLARIETELGLRDYQRKALRRFVDRGGRGIAHMATGTGKTRIGIGAIRWALEGGHKGLVLVPTRALLEQWRGEVLRHTNLDQTQVRAVSGSRSIRRMPQAEVLLTPIQTAMRNPETLARMAEQQRRALLIVDECHRAGAPQYSNALVDAIPYRLGLSATPERPFDPAGTQRVIEYFEGVAHRYDLGTAVEEGHLASYTYHLHSTYLNEFEQVDYEELSTAISHVMADIHWRYPKAPKLTQLGELLGFLRAEEDGEAGELADELQELLFRRARIVKNAQGKVRIFRRLCDRLDGKKTIVFSEEISFAERLGQVASQQGLSTYLYHSEMNSQARDRTLSAYREADGGVLLAVRALDEGLDVPDADVAVLAASSTSQRQHIQRRGRVLRPLRDRRKLAELHDFYVIGVDDPRRVERIREDADRIVYHGFEQHDPEDLGRAPVTSPLD